METLVDDVKVLERETGLKFPPLEEMNHAVWRIMMTIKMIVLSVERN